MRLTAHFTLEEMTKSATADANGIDNSLPDTSDKNKALIESLTLVAERVLEPARKHFGLPITPGSGYRCPALNVAVGGSPASQHMKGEAVDFEVKGVPNIDLAYWLAENIKDFDQIILERYNEGDANAGWVHISVSSYSSRKSVRTMGLTVSAMGLPARTKSGTQVTKGECK